MLIEWIKRLFTDKVAADKVRAEPVLPDLADNLAKPEPEEASKEWFSKRASTMLETVMRHSQKGVDKAYEADRVKAASESGVVEVKNSATGMRVEGILIQNIESVSAETKSSSHHLFPSFLMSFCLDAPEHESKLEEFLSAPPPEFPLPTGHVVIHTVSGRRIKVSRGTAAGVQNRYLAYCRALETGESQEYGPTPYEPAADADGAGGQAEDPEQAQQP